MAKSFLSRYTDLPSLIHILSSRTLTLLDPMLWDDRNDANFITLYREKCELASVLALCFSRASETYHHWRVFAPSASGVCIRFDADRLRACAGAVPDVTFREVEYLTLDGLRAGMLDRGRLPFLKRHPFKPESEMRMLWQSATEVRGSLGIPLDLAAISRITLSPWLHPSLVPGVKSVIRHIAGCGRIGVYRSTLVDNAEWLKHGAAAR